MPDYPYTNVTGADANDEGRVYVNIEVQPDGLNIDEDALIDSIKSSLLGQAGVASVTAMRLSITSTQV